MSKIIKTELFKLKHNKNFYVTIIVMIAAHIGLGMIDNDQSTFADYMTSFSSLLPLFTAALCIALVQNDYNWGTLKNVVSSGISRKSIYLGKLFVVFIATAILFVIEGIVSLGVLYATMPNITIDFAVIIPSFLIQIVVALNYSVIFFLIGSVIRSTGFSIILCYVIYLFDAAAFGYVGNFLHISNLSDYSLGGVTLAVENISVDTVSIMHLGVITVVIIVAALIGSIAFSKQDIK